VSSHQVHKLGLRTEPQASPFSARNFIIFDKRVLSLDQLVWVSLMILVNRCSSCKIIDNILNSQSFMCEHFGTLSPPHLIVVINILDIRGEYIWTFERFARHLRETCESLASNVYCCLRLRAPAEHLWATCVWLESKTCEYLRASACWCHRLRVTFGETLGSIFPQRIYIFFKTKPVHFWAHRRAYW